MRGRPGASFQCRPAIAGRLRQGQSALPLSGGPCAAAASGRRTGGRRVCLRCGGIECETGGVRCLYGRTVRPGWGIRTPVGSHPAVFKTAAIPFRQIRRWWRPLPPLNRSFRRVRRQQVKNGGGGTCFRGTGGTCRHGRLAFRGVCGPGWGAVRPLGQAGPAWCRQPAAPRHGEPVFGDADGRPLRTTPLGGTILGGTVKPGGG